MKKTKIIIGTRGSKLALWQAEWVKSALLKLNPGLTIELNKIKTTGDNILDVPLAKVGGKGLFVKEIEEAILRGEADLAVHSMKDVPTDFPKGLHLAVICKREDPRDAFISGVKGSRGQGVKGKEFHINFFRELPKGATVGTSSLRRSCQLLSIRPDLKIEQLRGNLDTRLRKLDEGRFDAIILAAAGVKRLGWAERITETIEPEVSLPAIGQGAIGIECRVEDDFIKSLIAPLNHDETSICVRAERACLKKLEGGCQVPIAAHARLVQKSETKDSSLFTVHCSLAMDGLVGSVSGDRIIKSHIEGNPKDAESLGIKLAEDLLSRGAKEILDEVYGKNLTQINGKIAS
ncbi:MAG TPA: hydroxymethylbilane synthase [Nitrospiraceae bacterium]|nr:hydroxymethylbilane synthase [Nitrospiraceae bacterium]